MSEIKLLPCPFCGGEAIKSAFCWAGISDESTIECTMCGARTKVLKTEEAIQSWNTRKPMQEIVEKLEEKEEWTRTHGTDAKFRQGRLSGLRSAMSVVKEVGGIE